MGIDWQSRRDGFEHRTDKPIDRPINWKYWASLPALKQWDACALSVNVNPDNLKARRMVMPGMPVFLPESFPSRAVELEFNSRLTMFNRRAGGNHLAEVSPQWFAAWCLHVGLENLPPELVAMATPEPKAAPVATPEPPAAPVVAESASVEPAGPLPMTTGDIAFCFAGLRWKTEDEWKKPLGDKPKWLEACIAIPGRRGVSETRWSPVLIGAALVRDGHVKANSVRAKFQTQPLLTPWLDEWKTYEADNSDSN